MSDVGTILTVSLALYALGMCVFLISENRRPQATLAWMLAFIFAPGIGVLIYLLFGRDRKAFSKQSKLLRQDLEANARPLLAPMLSRQDAEIARLEGESASRRKLMMLVRRNSHSALTTRNRVEIQQDAAEFYPSLMEDMKAARHSIHLQYFIWGADAFTEGLKEILIAKARAGVEVRLLYDPHRLSGPCGPRLCQGHAGGGDPNGAHLAPLPAAYDQLPQPPQDHRHRRRDRLYRRHEYRPGAPRRREGIRLLARHPGAHRRGGRGGVAGGVHGGLVQRRQGEPVFRGILSRRTRRSPQKATCRSRF